MTETFEVVVSCPPVADILAVKYAVLVKEALDETSNCAPVNAAFEVTARLPECVVLPPLTFPEATIVLAMKLPIS